MKERGYIELELLDYWRCSAGRGLGRYLDDTVVKTKAGLPLVPGRTLKGLLRDAMRRLERLGHVEPGRTEALFGSEMPDASNSTDRFSTTAGKLWLGDATLPGDWEAWAVGEQGRALVAGFFDEHASTRLDADRVASARTLRRVEVAVPCTLRARFECDAGADVFDDLTRAARMVRRLGRARNRGFGRVSIRVGLEGSMEGGS